MSTSPKKMSATAVMISKRGPGSLVCATARLSGLDRVNTGLTNYRNATGKPSARCSGTMVLAERTMQPVRLQRRAIAAEPCVHADAVFVGHGTKWANPFKKPDVDALRSEPDVEAAYRRGGWREAAKLVYRDFVTEEGLDPHELRGKDLICTCRPSDPCHADVLLELANAAEEA